MAMLVRFELSPKNVGELSEFLNSILPDTRTFRGCHAADAFVGIGQENIVLLEEWEDKSCFDEYLNWRKERGDFDSLISKLEQTPRVTYFSKEDEA